MNRKIRTTGFCVLLALWAVLAVWLWFGPKADYTIAERRKLAQMPQISVNSVFSGKFMPDFEDFTLDQFPLRDSFRQVKSLLCAEPKGQQRHLLGGGYRGEDRVPIK